MLLANKNKMLEKMIKSYWTLSDTPFFFRFIQVETAFFWKWWENQDDVMRAKFRNLVENGQIEIVNGAWSMNDEACVNYQSTIDQFTWAFKYLLFEMLVKMFLSGFCHL